MNFHYLPMLLVHLAGMYVLALLFFSREPIAPDPVQLVFLAVAFVGMGFFAFADLLQLYGVSHGRELFGATKAWPASAVGGAITQGAILVYLLRQWWLKTKMCDTFKGTRHDGARQRRAHLDDRRHEAQGEDRRHEVQG
jgi:hypothetical protein